MADFFAHFQTQPGIEVGEWFVQQQHVWLDHQRARQRHALLLAARKLVRRAVGIFFHLHNRKRFGHPLFFLRRAHGPHLQAVSHVLRHSQVRPQRVVLKNHARVAPMRRHTAHRLVAEEQLPCVGLIETRDQPQQRRLATAGWAEEEEEFLLVDPQRNVFQHGGVAESLRQVLNRYAHDSSRGERAESRERADCDFVGPRPWPFGPRQFADISTAPSLPTRLSSGYERLRPSTIRPPIVPLHAR